jgi:hypothetical protein
MKIIDNNIVRRLVHTVVSYRRRWRSKGKNTISKNIITDYNFFLYFIQQNYYVDNEGTTNK